jgi:hypothetical protein
MRAHERRRTEQSEPERSERAPERPPAGLDVLALQRSAGNHAVSALLARQPTDTEEAAPAKATLTRVGVIPLDSFSQNLSGPRQIETGEPSINCVSKVGGHSGKLQTFNVNGETFDAELEHLKSGFKLNRTNAHVSSYSVSNHEGVPYEHWTIDTPPPRE